MRIKEKPEDFAVQEVKTIPKQATGKYVYFLMRKKNRTTQDVVEELARKLKLQLKHIGYAGNKDKIAVTEQYLSFFGVGKEQVKKVSLKDVVLTYVTHANERITLGSLEGNKFVIVVRNLQEKKELKIQKVKNYFDDQRFGAKRNNHVLGKLLLQKKYGEVCKLLQLKVKENDFVGALRSVAKKTLRFYVHSYQSHLWNKIAAKLEQNCATVPLLGYLTELTGEVKTLYDTLLHEEGIKQEDFLLPAMPELSSEGGDRIFFAPVKDFTATWEQDELHEEQYKVTLTFLLPPGVYATMVVKQLFTKVL